MSDDRKTSRRELFASWFNTMRSASVTAANPAKLNPETALRPPGALKPDEDFLAACTGCGDCIPVCPPSCIVALNREDDKMVPVINPSAAACHLCTDLPCIAACDPGALIDPGGPERVRLGIAKVDPRRCITFKGEICRRCYSACPYPDRAIMMIGGRPLIGSGACTGCGLCQKACPEHPKAIYVVPERQLVPGLRIPRDEYKPG